jgi:hypothetical protein
MKLRMGQLNCQGPRGRFGRLCVSNNGECLCDSLEHFPAGEA